MTAQEEYRILGVRIYDNVRQHCGTVSLFVDWCSLTNTEPEANPNKNPTMRWAGQACLDRVSKTSLVVKLCLQMIVAPKLLLCADINYIHERLNFLCLFHKSSKIRPWPMYMQRPSSKQLTICSHLSLPAIVMTMTELNRPTILIYGLRVLELELEIFL